MVLRSFGSWETSHADSRFHLRPTCGLGMARRLQKKGKSHGKLGEFLLLNAETIGIGCVFCTRRANITFIITS